MAACNKQKLRH